MDRQDRRRIPRRPIRKKTHRRKIKWKRLFVALAILVGILWGIGAACSWAYHAIFDSTETTEVAEEPATEVAAEEALPPVRTAPAWSTSALASATAEDKLAASRKTINLLLIGADDPKDGEYYGDADSIVLLIVNTEDDTAAMISLPSNLRMPIAGQADAITLREVYKQGGTPLTLRLVEEYLGITIPYYATVDHAVFTGLIDELGGVDLYVEEDMAYTDSYDGYTIDLHKGYQTLDGEKAQQYIRYVDRELGEVGRMKRQHRFVKAMIAQHASFGSIFDIPLILSILEDESDSNLTFYPLMKIVNVVSDYQPNMTLGELLPGHLASDANGVWWLVDQAKADAMFWRIFKIDVPKEAQEAQTAPNEPIKLTEVKAEKQEVQTGSDGDNPNDADTAENTNEEKGVSQ